MSSVLEKELTCSICTDILFDPVTYLDCLHTNCGSCSKSWFASRATATCPECRQQVRGVKQNASITSLLEDFLSRNPGKRRAEDDAAQCRALYKPGDDILGGGSRRGGRFCLFDPGEPITPAATPPTLFPTTRSTVPPPLGLQNYRAGRSTSTLLTPVSPTSGVSAGLSRGGTPPWGGFNEFPSLMDLDAALPGFSAGLSTRHQQMFQQFLSNGPVMGSPAHSPPLGPFSRSPPSSPRRSLEPRSISELFRSGTSRVPTISCNECRKSVNNNLHYECTACTMYHLCTSCYRGNKTCPYAVLDTSHVLLPQKVISTLSEPRPHLQTGVFCSMCEEWADEDRGERTYAPNSFFWQCETCNDGHWTYCQRCVVRGLCCTHTLTLWTNSRSPPQLATLFGTNAPPLVFGPPRETVTSRLPSSMAPGARWLEARGYGKWRNYRLTCDICNHTIFSWNSWLHCTQCEDGRWDVCDNCALLLPSSPSGQKFCHNRHELSVLSLSNDSAVGLALRAIQRPRVNRPDMVSTGEPGIEGVVATQSCWDGERAEGRKWGGGQQLCFPKGAGISDVVCAFVDEEDEERWWWGVYAGVGGIFSGSMVRFT